MPSTKKGKDLKASHNAAIVGTYVKRETPLELPSKLSLAEILWPAVL